MRALIFSLCLLLISGCSFSPLHTNGTGADTVRRTSQIQVAPIADAIGYQMRMRLESKLKSDDEEKKRYLLSVKLEENIVGDLGIQKTNFATRSRLILTAHYTLKDTETNTVLIDDSRRMQGSYNLTNPYSTMVSLDKMREDLARGLADNIAVRVLAYFKQQEAVQ